MTVKLDLTKIHTNKLIKMLRKTYDCRYDDHDDPTADDIKAELATREHVLKKDQKQLIKQMSMKVGKRLNLREAQDVFNRIRRSKI